ncbi:CRISPR-associated endonuclease Cas1 [Nitrosarchaeum sp.]|uniref:CRISPR-associated endonuclease Cas1 n=1 Tax=Nitrosarchaeum sp. TaxID=2026886 RepID=UPI00247C4B24|nr:CRISPR-associated endonuclease Cas1 [Nitrosarchaeum sp.]MCV0411582.1 CRISPR-associated endonuclease Cas1 [Nitrosarchaeum sp.]
MTLKNHKNHYNIKFLKGYGHSISIKNSKIILKDCHDPFSESTTESWYIKNMPYEKIVLQGKGYISTDALALLSENNRNVILLDNHGKPVTYLNPVMESLTATRNRIAQYDTFRNKEKCQYLQKMIVKAKLESQIRFLKLTERDEVKEAISKLEIHLLNLDDHSPISNESKTSHIYFRAFAKLIPERYEFSSRNPSYVGLAKNNATDIINALLNYGYSVLAGEISKFVNGFGLDAYYGFYHKSHTGFQPLVYDMMEPFRWLVDYTVFKISNIKDHKQRIRLDEFTHTRDGIVIMEYNLIRKFLELLERTFQSERRYSFRHGAKTKDGLKNVQEITIAKVSVQNLAEYCLRK